MISIDPANQEHRMTDHALIRIVRGSLACMLISGSLWVLGRASEGKAQIIPYGSTRIRAYSKGFRPLSPCQAAVCQVVGGEKAGQNTFHLFRQFDTRPYTDLRAIRFRNPGNQRIWVGVGEGPIVFDKAIRLSSPSNATFLSPYGIALLKGTSLRNMNWPGFIRAAGFIFENGSQFIPDTAATPVIEKGATSEIAGPIELGIKIEDRMAFSDLLEQGPSASEFPMVLARKQRLALADRMTFGDFTPSPGSGLILFDKTRLRGYDWDPSGNRLDRPSIENFRGRIDFFTDGDIRIQDSTLEPAEVAMTITPGGGSSTLLNSKIRSSSRQDYVSNLYLDGSELRSPESIVINSPEYVRMNQSLLQSSPREPRRIGNILIKIKNQDGAIVMDSGSRLDVSAHRLSYDGGNIKLKLGINPSNIQLEGSFSGKPISSAYDKGSLFAYFFPKSRLGNVKGMNIYACRESCSNGTFLDQVFRDVSNSRLADGALADIVRGQTAFPSIDLQGDINELIRSKDQIATARVIALLGLRSGIDYRATSTPTSSQIQRSLQEIRLYDLQNTPRAARQSPSKDPSLGYRREGSLRSGSTSFEPAVLYLSLNSSGKTGDLKDDFIDIIVVPCCAKPLAKRVFFDRRHLQDVLKRFYASVSTDQAGSGSGSEASPVASRELYAMLFEPIDAYLRSQSIDTLLVFADQGLQALPLGALHDGEGYLSRRLAFSISPSLALANFPHRSAGSRSMLHLSSSRFESLPALPAVQAERDALGAVPGFSFLADTKFTPKTFRDAFVDQNYSSIHVSSHADFSFVNPLRSLIYTSDGAVGMGEFRELRLSRDNHPLDLFVLSACRTALGDPLSELGFSGLALQSGARSAIGTLWYVDDLATSSFFVQFYKLLFQGVPKLEAFRLTQSAFQTDQIRISGTHVLGLGDEVLLSGILPHQQKRYKLGFSSPYYWAGIQMIGLPW